MPEATAAPTVREPRLVRWAHAFNCYTAALATWSAVRTEAWWRPLLDGGPVLTVREAGAGLLRFDHHARPPLETLGLALRHADNWREAREAQHAELAAHGALVVCGDTYHQPWQRGHRRWHAPHWFTVVRDGRGDAVEDALSLVTDAGRQRPRRIAVRPGEFAAWARALPGTDPVHRLRELSATGGDARGPGLGLGLGARYRWLVRRPGAPGQPRDGDNGAARPTGTAPAGTEQAGTASLTGADAVLAVAERFRSGPARGLRQADDLWQALRQRELLLAAAETDPALLDGAALRHWQAATVLWRRVPPRLAYLRLREEAGLTTDTSSLVGVLTELAPFEGHHRVAGRSAPR